MIYEWSAGHLGFDYSGKTKDDIARLCWYDSVIGEPLPDDLKDWVVPNLEQYIGGKRAKKLKPVGDITSSTLPIISKEAAEALNSVLDGCRLYPVNLEGAEPLYFIVIVDAVIDCLVREKSEGKVRQVGKLKGLFGPLEKWVFDESHLGDRHIFRLPDSSTAYYVTEKFKQTVVNAKLKGFCFKTHFWEENPFIS